jgi:uncharacterized protein
MQFDHYTITLLIRNPEGPDLDEQAAAGLQDAHMAHLADLHEAGHLLAAGPLFDDDYRGLSILDVEPSRTRELKEHDPAVRAGVYTILAIPWMVPGGAMTFAPARFPRSMTEAQGD